MSLASVPAWPFGPVSVSVEKPSLAVLALSPFPASPLLRTITREPVSTPAGMRTFTVSFCVTRPLPRQAAQGLVMIFPSPLQLVQVEMSGAPTVRE